VNGVNHKLLDLQGVQGKVLIQINGKAPFGCGLSGYGPRSFQQENLPA